MTGGSGNMKNATENTRNSMPPMKKNGSSKPLRNKIQ